MHPPESDLIYDWNRAGGAAVPRARKGRARRRDPARRPAVSFGPEPLDRAEAPDPSPDGGPRHRLGRHRPARAPARTWSRRDAAGQEIVAAGMKIRPNCAARTVAADILPDHRDLAAGRDPDRGRLLHRLLAHPPVRRGLGPRPDAPACRRTPSPSPSERGCRSCTSPRTRRARTPTTSARLYTAAIRAGARTGLRLRHGRPRDAQRRSEPDPVRLRRSSTEVNPEVRGRLARPPGPRARRAPTPSGRSRPARTASTPARSASASASATRPMDQLLVNLQLLGWIDRDLTKLSRVLRPRLGGDRRPDPRQLSGRRARRLPHRDGRARRGDHQGPQEGGRLARRPGLLGRAGGDGRPHADDRGRPDERDLERAVLAGEPRHRAAPGARRRDLPPGEGERPASWPTRRSSQLVQRVRSGTAPPTNGPGGQPGPPPGGSGKGGQFLLRELPTYLDHLAVERGLSRATVAAYRSDLERFGRWLAKARGALGAARRGRSSARYLRRAADRAGSLRAPRRARSRPCAASTASRRPTSACAEDPTAQLTSPRAGVSLPKALTEREVESLLRAPDPAVPSGLRDRAMLELLYASGLRVSEIVGLPRDRRRSGRRDSPRDGKGGQGASRSLRHVGVRLDHPVPRGGPARASTGRAPPSLFLTARGGAMTRQRFWQLVEAYGRAGRDPRAPDPPRPSPLLCHAPAGARRGPARPPDDARPRGHCDDPDLHAGLRLAGCAGSTTVTTPGRHADGVAK